MHLTIRSKGVPRWSWLLGCALAVAAATGHPQDGWYDTTWAASGRQLIDVGSFNESGYTLAIQRDDKLVLAGTCDVSLVLNRAFCAARLRSNGALDLEFGPNETGRIVLNEHPGFPPDSHLGFHGLALQLDGRILLAGSGRFDCGGASCTSGILARLSAAGNLEPGPGGAVFREVVYSSHMDPNLRYNTVAAVVATSAGKIMAVGTSARAGASPANHDFGVARFNADLTPDASFNGTGTRLVAFDLAGSFQDIATAAAVQADGKIVVTGYVSGETGASKAAVVRLNADGSADQGFGTSGRVTFGSPGSGDLYVHAVALDQHSRILVAGHGGNGTVDFFVARLTAQGQLDASFNGGIAWIFFDLGAPFSDGAADVLVQTDGKILVTGSASYTTTPHVRYRFAVARLTANGQLDPAFGVNGRSDGTFAPPSQTSATNDAAMASAIGNGGLMIAGHGRAQDGSTRFGVAKLKLDLVFVDGFQP